MIYDFETYELSPLGGGAPFRFRWNSTTGALGDLPINVRSAIYHATQRGEAYITLHPTRIPYPTPDPLHNPEQMAIVLCDIINLPPELAELLPKIDHQYDPSVIY